MWSGWRYVLRIRLAQATEPARGFHALFKCCEAAICGTAKSVAINRAPRIVLSFCWSVQHSCCDDNTERKQDKSHPYLTGRTSVKRFPSPITCVFVGMVAILVSSCVRDYAASPARDAALRECNSEASKWNDRDWETTQAATYQNCMTRHGQIP